MFNSAFLYTPEGLQAPQKYDKIHLVPFGEVLPFRKTFPAVYNLLMKFTPYNYDYSLDYGSDYTVFEMTTVQQDIRTYKFSVLICYEDVVLLWAGNLLLGKMVKKDLTGSSTSVTTAGSFNSRTKMSCRVRSWFSTPLFAPSERLKTGWPSCEASIQA